MLHLSSSSYLALCLSLLAARPPWQRQRVAHLHKRNMLFWPSVFQECHCQCLRSWEIIAQHIQRYFWGGERWLISILLKRELYIKGSSALGFNSCWPLEDAVRKSQLRDWQDVKSGTFCGFHLFLIYLFIYFLVLLLSLFVYFLDMFPFHCTETCMQTTCGRVLCASVHASSWARAPQRVEEREREREEGDGASACFLWHSFEVSLILPSAH